MKASWPKLPHLQVYRARNNVYSYYRRDGTRQRIHGEPGSAAWLARYAEIHRSFEKPNQISPYSLAALVDKYMKSPDFAGLAEATQRQYRAWGHYLSDIYGRVDVRRIDRQDVRAARDVLADKPASANAMVRVLRLLLTHAIDIGWRTDNPASRPKQLRTGPGHAPWSDRDIATFRKAWKAGTPERTIFELLLNTGQRIGDLPRLDIGREITVTQGKTGTRLTIPVNKPLRAALDACPLPDWGTSFISHTMTRARRKAGLGHLTSHGLRHTAATILMEQGLDSADIRALTGHSTVRMVEHYTRQKRGAQKAAKGLESV